MSWLVLLHATALVVASALAVSAGVVVRGRREVPGSKAFAWMNFATAYWAILSALHVVVSSYDVRVRIAQAQYIGIAAIAPLWVVFSSQYARSRWLNDRTLMSLLWVLPITTVVMAFTNSWHRLLWADIRPVDGGLRLQYVHGAWFFVAVIYSYLALTAATGLLLKSLKRFPLPYRRQTAFIVGALAAPWVANIVYLLELLPPGIDPTPIAFAVSGVLFFAGFARHDLFGLVPIARDLVIDSLSDGVIVLDHKRHIVDLNPAAPQLAGCEVDCIGQPIEKAVTWWALTATERSLHGPLPRAITVDGKTLEIEVKPVRDGDSRFVGWLVLLRDVTARRKTESDRRLLERRMLEQQRLESLSVLAGGVAHDFNNLLTGILGNADLIVTSKVQDAAIRKSADTIVASAQRAADLIAKMLAYAGEGRVISESIDLDALIKELLDLLRPSLARHCRLEYTGGTALPRVRVDPVQIRQVILNLIANANEAVEEGGRIAVASGCETLTEGQLNETTLRTDASPGRFAYIEVSDSGPGMDGMTLSRIFDPFFTTKQTGRGLGLAAVQGIVRSHHGALRAHSTPGRGTTIRVWFPLESPIAEATT